jgi:site-specific DNA recombinase
MARRDRRPKPARELFEAVQTQLAERKVRRKLARSKSSAILMGLIFDDRGHPMSPSHANKKGVRYRYYVSHALLQSRKANAGSIARVSAPDVEALACNAVKQKERSASQSEGARLYRDDD